MKSAADEINRMFLWLLLIASFLSLLFYGLSSFVAEPTVETITIQAINTNSNANTMREVKFQSRKKSK